MKVARVALNRSNFGKSSPRFTSGSFTQQRTSFVPTSSRVRTPIIRRGFSSSSKKTTLVVAEHDYGANVKVLAGTLNTIKAAEKLGGDVKVLLAGDFKGNKDIAKQVSKIEPVSEVIVADRPHYKHGLAESLALLLKNCKEFYNPTHILAPATTFGKNLIPRFASLVNSGMISDVISIESEDTFQRPIYAGNVIAKVKSLDPLKILTIRTTAFEKANEGSKEAQIVDLPSEIQTPDFEGATWIKDELRESSRPELTTARVVVSGGRGMQSGKNFVMLEELADVLGGAVGASRAAVDAGFVPNDLQVGQTGKIVAPELYIAVGISGAIQHLAGMKDSKVIVAINKDAEAPIFQVADYGIVGDLFQAIPEFTEAAKKAKSS